MITISVSSSAPLFGPIADSSLVESKADSTAEIAEAEYLLIRNETQVDLMKIFVAIYLAFENT